MHYKCSYFMITTSLSTSLWLGINDYAGGSVGSKKPPFGPVFATFCGFLAKILQKNIHNLMYLPFSNPLFTCPNYTQ